MSQGINPSAQEIMQAFNYDSFELNPHDEGKTGIATTNDGKMFHTDHGGKPLYSQKYDQVVHFKNGQSFASIGKDKLVFWTDKEGKIRTRTGRH